MHKRTIRYKAQIYRTEDTVPNSDMHRCYRKYMPHNRE